MTRFEFRQATVVVGIFLLVAAHLFPCAAIRAEDAADVNSVEVIGSSIVYNNDVAMARDVAIRDGLRKAVENAVGVILSSESIVENFQLLSDRIYTESRGFVQGYKVLAESRSENCYNIVIQATVSAGTLRDELQALGILMAQKGMPRTMFFLAEQSIGESQPHLSADLGITENKIAEEMAARGFVLVDRSAAANDIELANVLGTARLADQTAVKLGNQHDAEIVIVGKALARYTKNVMGSQMKSYQANISVKAIRTDTGEIIASSTRSGAAVHTDDVSGGTAALKRVASQAAGDLITQITAKWQREVVESQLVLITVNGIKAYSDFVAFRRILSNRIRGVKNVYLRGIDAGEARMDVQIKGTAQTLADELMLKNFDGFGINIFNVSQNAIQLTLVPKG
ncbi:MAG: DUF6175 family protein [Deltaproteobacteria bacterium]|jgi:hypothetical protein|nr:DUF6175 family protein [Deltaproteobacteria bacterium]